MIHSICKNKKGGAIGFVFFAGLFLLFWIFVLSAWITTAGTMAAQGKTGIELFFYSNLNFFIFIGFSLFMLWGFAS